MYSDIERSVTIQSHLNLWKERITKGLSFLGLSNDLEAEAARKIFKQRKIQQPNTLIENIDFINSYAISIMPTDAATPKAADFLHKFINELNLPGILTIKSITKIDAAELYSKPKTIYFLYIQIEPNKFNKEYFLEKLSAYLTPEKCQSIINNRI